MPLLMIIGLILLLLAGLVHLFFCFREYDEGRFISKLFLMPILAFILWAIPSHEIWLFLAIFFGWVGDIFLIFKRLGKRYLFFGLVSFLLGHFLYIFEIVRLLPFRVPFYVYLAAAILGAAMIMSVYRLLKPQMGKMAIPVGVYGVTLLTLITSAVALTATHGGGPAPFIILGGALAFTLSDSLIAYTYFYHDIRRRDFFIMIPYLLAESGLVIGIAYMLII